MRYDELGFFWCMCVAVYSWVCHSIVDRFVHLSGKAYWGWCLGVCISLVGGGVLCSGALGVTWVGYCCCCRQVGIGGGVVY